MSEDNNDQDKRDKEEQRDPVVEHINNIFEKAGMPYRVQLIQEFLAKQTKH